MNRYIFSQAVKVTTPIFFGYIAIGMPFGIMLVNAGYPWWLSIVMGLFMYTGAGQYIAVGMFASHAPLSEILIAEFFVNIRHIVYGLSLISKFRGIGRWKPYIIYALTDETYAILTNVTPPKNARPGSFYGTIALLDELYWILGGLLGAILCSVLQHYNLTRYLQGVDFALTALFIVILIDQIKSSKDFVPPLAGLIAGTGAVILSRLGFIPQTNIIIVAISLALAAIVLIKGPQFKQSTQNSQNTHGTGTNGTTSTIGKIATADTTHTANATEEEHD